MDHTEYDVLICGATFAGLGAAAAARAANRSVLVIERTSLVGREFIDAFNNGCGWEKGPVTDFGRSFRTELIGRNLMEEHGPLHLPALHPVLCALIKQFDIPVKFLTEIVDIAQHGGNHHVLLHNASGLQRATALHIIDTSSERLSTPGSLFKPSHTKLNAYLHKAGGSDGPLPGRIDETMAVAAGRFPSEKMIKLSVEPEGDWPQARQKLFDYWVARPEEWAPWTIAAIAGAFEADVPRGERQLGQQWSWLPSEGFDHPLEAIDLGYEYSASKEGNDHAAAAKQG